MPNSHLTPESAKYMDLEAYLATEVRSRFESNGELDGFDFFCIVIWKANRAKSKVAQRLLHSSGPDLDRTSRQITRDLAAAVCDEERLFVLTECWGFRLPIASAILATLYPASFSVYDVRVAEVLGRFKSLAERRRFDQLWRGYQQFLKAVAKRTPGAHTWRERDRILWGTSFERQLRKDLAQGFIRAAGDA